MSVVLRGMASWRLGYGAGRATASMVALAAGVAASSSWAEPRTPAPVLADRIGGFAARAISLEIQSSQVETDGRDEAYPGAALAVRSEADLTLGFFTARYRDHLALGWGDSLEYLLAGEGALGGRLSSRPGQAPFARLGFEFAVQQRGGLFALESELPAVELGHSLVEPGHLVELGLRGSYQLWGELEAQGVTVSLDDRLAAGAFTTLRLGPIYADADLRWLPELGHPEEVVHGAAAFCWVATPWMPCLEARADRAMESRRATLEALAVGVSLRLGRQRSLPRLDD